MKKGLRFACLLCLLAMVLLAVPAKAQAAQTHTHCVCGGSAGGIGDHVCENAVTWQPWDGTTTLKDGGHYYLNDTDGDGVITLTSKLTIEKKTVSLCLNGVELTCADRTINVNGVKSNTTYIPAGLNICDCQGGGSITSTYDGVAPVLHSFTSSRGDVTINFYGGSLIAKDNNATTDSDAGVLRVGNNTAASGETQNHKATFNMYGGSISGGKTKKSAGNVWVSIDCEFNLYAGTVSGGQAGDNGGNFYVSGHLNLQGGTVTGGEATLLGGGIYLDAKEVNKARLTVGGTARVENNNGSNVYLPAGKTLTANGEGNAHVGITCADAVFAQAATDASAGDFFSDTQEKYIAAFYDGGLQFISPDQLTRISKISLQPSVMGMGYKARYDVPAHIRSQVSGYGYQLWLDGYPVHTYTANKPMTDGMELTLRLKNIMRVDNDILTNFNQADMQVNARSFVKMTDGTCCYSEIQSYDLRQMLELADTHYQSFTQSQKDALQTMFTQYRDVMLGWDMPDVIHNNGSWVDLTQDNFAENIKTSGQYRLVEDVDLAGTTISIFAKANVTLCLNGHTISGTERLFKVYGSLTLCDCHADDQEGTLTSSYSGDYAPVAYLYQAAKMNIYGGKLTASSKVAKDGGVVVVGNTDGMDCRLNMFGGSISGGQSGNGGALLWVINTSTFNMYGGELYDGKADGNGGAINMGAKSNVKLYGGKIYNCTAGGKGGAIYTASGEGELHLGSNLIMESNKAGQGGHVYHNRRTPLTVDGATVIKGEAENTAGGIYSHTAPITLSGNAVIRDNSNGSIYLHGGIQLNTEKLGQDADVHIYNLSAMPFQADTRYLTLEQQGYQFATVAGQQVIFPEGFTIPTDVEGFQVGYGRADISPTETGLPLAGYGNAAERLSTTTGVYVYDELKVSCVAITDEKGETVLLMSVDLIRPGADLMATIFPAVTAATGVPESHIFTTFTHTHSVPETKQTTNPKIQRYNAMLPDRFAEAANLAMNDRMAATIETGSLEVNGLNFTRHYQYQENGQTKYYGDNFGTAPTTAEGKKTLQHVTEADHTMHLVKFVREGTDILMANWRVHPHMTGGSSEPYVSADIIGTTRYHFEKDQDCHFIYLQGAAGNVNEKSKLSSEQYADGFTYYKYGNELVKQIKSAISNKCLSSAEIGLWQVENYEYLATADIPTEEEYTHAKNASEQYKAWLAENPGASTTQKKAKCGELGYLTWFHFNNVITRHSGSNKKLPLNAFSLGRSLAFYTAPGELWDTVSIEMENDSPFAMTLCIGYSQDHYNYFVYDPNNGGQMTYESYESNNYHFVAPTTINEMIAWWKTALQAQYEKL